MQLLSRIIKEKLANEQETVIELKFKTQGNQTEEAVYLENSSEPENQALLELQQAESLARTMISEAQLEAENIKATAYHEGLQRGQQEADGIINETYSQVNQLLSEIEDYRQGRLEELKVDLYDLTVYIAEKILKAELSLGQDAISNIVLAAVDRVKNRKRINIFVNPENLNIIEEKRSEILRNLNEASLEIIPDPLIKIGGCRIHTETGWIDATIDNQLKELQTLLRL